MRQKRMLSIGALCLSASILLVGCGKEQNAQKKESSVTVKEMAVGMTAASGDYNYSGTVEEENATSLSFTLGGTITSLKVKVGDRVSKGQLIATVDPASVKNAHAMALATKQQAEDAYQRMKQLHDKGSLPDIKWVEVQSQLQQAVSAEKIARKNLSDCNLYAPSSGVVSEKYAEVGQNAAPGIPIIKLVTTQVMNVKVSIPETEVAQIRTGQHADILVSALQDKHYAGHVIEKGVVADPISRSYNIKVRIDGSDRALLPGMVTKVSIGKASSETAAIILPSRLLQLGDDNSYFVWVDEGGKAMRRTVVCGEFTANGVTIIRGLSQGDKVITEGQQKVCNGCNVKVATHSL